MTRCAESASSDSDGAKSLRFAVANVPGENPAEEESGAGVLVSRYNAASSTTMAAKSQPQKKLKGEAASLKC